MGLHGLLQGQLYLYLYTASLTINIADQKILFGESITVNLKII
jgi:hypothetical protein